MSPIVPLLALSAPPSEVVVFDANAMLRKEPTRERQWDSLHALAALQGIVNRKEPRLYIEWVDEGKVDRYWWSVMRRGWLKDARVVKASSIDDLLDRFGKSVRGLVAWDPRSPACSNVASTVAGVEDMLPVRIDPSPDSLDRRFRSRYRRVITIPAMPDKATAYRWAVDRYVKTGRCDSTRMGYYPDAFWISHPNGLPVERTLLSNHDYFVSHRGFFFDLGPWDDESPNDEPNQKPGTDFETLRMILRAAYDQGKGKMIHVGGFTPWDLKYTDFTHGKHGGVETEWRYAEVLSCFNAYMDADAPGLGPMANASFFQHFPAHAQATKPTSRIIRRPGVSYAAIYVGDYDSAAWLYRMMPELWDDPVRGEVPLSWAFNPNLADRFPVGLAYAHETATSSDAFVTGDSGAGYLNPGYLVPPRKWSDLPSGLKQWVDHCEPYYRRWGVDVTGFVIDGNAPPMSDEILKAYAKLSPGGVVAQKVPPFSLVDGVPFVRMGSDLDGNDIEASARLVAEEAKTPGFRIYRSILWSPSKHKALMDKARQLNLNLEFVTIPTLMELIKRAK